MNRAKPIFIVFLIITLVYQPVNATLYETTRSKLTAFKKSFEDNLQALSTCLRQKNKCTITKQQVYKALKIGGVIVTLLAAIKFYQPVKRIWDRTDNRSLIWDKIGNKSLINEDLLKASKQGSYNNLLFNLWMGADVNVQNKEGQTPLMLAAQNGDLKIMEELIKRGADPYIADRDNLTAFNYANFDRAGVNIYDQLNKFVLERSVQRTIDQEKRVQKKVEKPIVSARQIEAQEKLNSKLFYSNTPQKIKEALAQGADINTQNEKGQTALMLASRYGVRPAMQELINQGADETIKDKEGYIARDYARGGGPVVYDTYFYHGGKSKKIDNYEAHIDFDNYIKKRNEERKAAQRMLHEGRMKAIGAEQKDPGSYLHKLPEHVIESKLEPYLKPTLKK